MVKGGTVGVLLVLAQVAGLGLGCGSGKGNNGQGSAGQTGAGGQSAGTAGLTGTGGGGNMSGAGGAGGQGAAGGSYGWVSYPGAGYTVNAIWGDRASSLWAVTSGGQLLFFDGATWQFVFGGAMPALYTIWGLPGQTDIYFGGLGSQLYLVRGTDVFDLGPIAASENRAVWAARSDQVWVGSQSTGGGLSRYDLTVSTPSPTSQGPSDLQGVRAIWGPTADEIWVIDGAGELVHWVNQTWTRVTTIQNPRLFAIHGTSSRDIWAVGPYALLHWDGSVWAAIDQAQNAGFFAVWAAAPSDAWVVGDGGWTAHVTPTSFQGVASGTTVPLYSVWGTSPTDIWVGGQDGVLLHYEPTTGGGQPDAGRGCKEAGEACGPGECCLPYNCRRIANVTLCG
jgi:hypothetical protein